MSRICHALCALAVASCTSSSSPGPSSGNAIPVSTSSGTIEAISISPLALTPAFSTSIKDYYVRCPARSNSLQVTVQSSGGTTSGTYVVAENYALVAGDYWIRCLPSSFPTITVAAHPDAGTPTDGYYLVNSVPYVMVLDTNATPIWYEPTVQGCAIDSPAIDTLTYMPHAEYPYAENSIPQFESHDLDTGATTTIISPDAPTNEHELQQLDNGDYLLFADQHTQHVDLTGHGSGSDVFGSDETIDDCKIEEINGSGAIVWSWLGTEHVDARQESVLVSSNLIGGINVRDPFHCNAIDIGSNGDLLVSFRQASAVYDIDMATGTVLWKLGGTAYNKDGAPHIAVVDDAEGTFNLQHDARFVANGDITLFDDHGIDNGSSGQVARGIELSVDHTAGTAQVVWSAGATEESGYMGSFRRYADGDSVIGWGYLPNDHRTFSEYTADGNDVLDVTFSTPTVTDAVSYRAIKVPLSELDHDVLRATAAVGAQTEGSAVTTSSL